jgi:hypothetical protein
VSSAPQPQVSTDAALRVVRIIHLAMLASAVLYVLVGEIVGPKGFIGEFTDLTSGDPVPLDESVIWNGFVVLGVALAFVAIVLRQKLTSAAQETLLRSPGDAAALGRWRMAHIIAFALAESVVLFGLVLRILGAPLTQAAILYAIGIVALLVLSPRKPS